MPLHPKAQAFLEAGKQQGTPSWSELPPEESRRIFSEMKAIFGTGPDLPVVQNIDCDGVACRLYHPSENDTLPAIVYFHGGGWVLGDLETHDSLCRRMAIESNCAVVAVDYRLAPEHRFPAAADDCFAATKFIAEHGSQFGIETDKLVVAGDSAGGNLAAVVSLRARDEGGPTVSMQVLIYPITDRDFETGSYKEFYEDYGLSNPTMQFFWEQYAGDQELTTNPYACPLKAPNLSNLPKALVVTAEYDVLRDEGEAYAKKLEEAGCDATLRRFDGMLHGFLHFAGAFDTSVSATADIGSFIKSHFGN